jgi:hypothetical protein
MKFDLINRQCFKVSLILIEFFSLTAKLSYKYKINFYAKLFSELVFFRREGELWQFIQFLVCR